MKNVNVKAPESSSKNIQQKMLERCAVEAMVWGFPIVSQDAQHQASLRAGAEDNDIVFWSSPSGWMNQTTTANASIRYVILNYNTKSEGPIVLEVPPAAGAVLFGTIVDAWQVPLIDAGLNGRDEGKGGKYLILPPDFEGNIPDEYIPVASQTYNGFAGFRAIPVTESPSDVSAAIGLIKKMKVYPLSKSNNPPVQRFVDVYGKEYNGIVSFDERFYVSLAKMINEEPVLPKDKQILGLITSLGIEKGKEFKPDAATQKILKEAAKETHEWFMQSLTTFGTQFWPGLSWLVPVNPIGPKSGFTWDSPDYFDIQSRGIAFFSFNTPPAKLGTATFYVATYTDGNGEQLNGGNNYKLHIPANVPVQQYWAVTLYDLETCCFFRDVSRVSLDSYDQKLSRNSDGSVDIYFGPKPPAGKEGNWIPTLANRNYFPWFRFYGPEKSLFDKIWKLPEIEKLND